MDDLRPELFAPSQLLLAPERMLLRTGCESGQALVVREGVIADVGAREAVCARNPDLTARELPGHLLMPGFIDAHHHLTQSFGKALAFGEPSEIFRRIWIPLEGFLDENAVYLASKLAALESLRGGFTTVVDAGTRSEADVESVARATEEVGLRCVLGLICNDAGPAAGGGAGSIGRAAARRFLAEGARVTLLDLEQRALDDAAAALNSKNVTVAVCDVTDSRQVDTALAAAADRWGAIHVIFSNAGNPGFVAPLADYPEDAFDRTMVIHARGAFLACKLGQKYLARGGWGIGKHHR